jgi:hypothetical protein
VDNITFFLVEKLLRPGGWLLFDDLYWTYANDVGYTEMAKAMPKEQRTVPQIERVFSLLVCQHPSFENMSIRGTWGWAQKKQGVSAEKQTLRNVVGEVYAQQGILSDVAIILNKFRLRHVIERAKRRNIRSL